MQDVLGAEPLRLVSAVGGLTVGTGQSGGRNTGTADHFDQTSQVVGVLDFTDLPDGSTAVGIWSRDGAEIERSEREVRGTGWVSFSLRSPDPGGLQPGTYTLTVTVGGRVLGRKTFTIGTPAPTAVPAPTPAPPDLEAYRRRTGETFAFRLRGRTTGIIWGTGTYSDDSDLATAAVHAGAVRGEEEGIVGVRILPGRDHYTGSTRNGVTSESWGRWGGSFEFVTLAPTDPPAVPTPPPAGPAAAPAPAPPPPPEPGSGSGAEEEPAELVAAREILGVADLFRRLAQVSCEEALDRICALGAAQRQALEAALGDQQRAYAFFTDAYLLLGRVEAARGAFAYHHPWTDLLLIGTVELGPITQITDLRWHAGSAPLMALDLLATEFHQTAQAAADQAKAVLMQYRPQSAAVSGPWTGTAPDVHGRLVQYDQMRTWSSGMTSDKAIPPILATVNEFLSRLVRQGVAGLPVTVVGPAEAQRQLVAWIAYARATEVRWLSGPICLHRQGASTQAALVLEDDPSAIVILGLETVGDRTQVTRLGVLDLRAEP